MPPEPKRPIPVTGRTEEETTRLHEAFRVLYARFYPVWELEIERRLEMDKPTRADWSFVELAELALSVQDGPMTRWQRLKLRGQILFELGKSLIPITKREMKTYVGDVADQVTGSFIGMWLSVLAAAAQDWGGTLYVARLDGAMLPTGFDEEVIEAELGIGDIPFEDIRALLSQVRLGLPDGLGLPPEVEVFMEPAGIKVSGNLKTVN